MGRRLPNGRKPVDSCVVVLLVGASLLTGLGLFIHVAAGWVL